MMMAQKKQTKYDRRREDEGLLMVVHSKEHGTGGAGTRRSRM